ARSSKWTRPASRRSTPRASSTSESSGRCTRSTSNGCLPFNTALVCAFVNLLPQGVPHMLRHVARFGLLPGLFALLLSGSSGADKPTKAEIAKRGKAATAFVEVPNRGTGTAFCVHPSGLFVTNEHVIRGGENAEVTLVLNPSLATQKVLKAKVVRVDK